MLLFSDNLLIPLHQLSLQQFHPSLTSFVFTKPVPSPRAGASPWGLWQGKLTWAIKVRIMLEKPQVKSSRTRNLWVLSEPFRNRNLHCSMCVFGGWQITLIFPRPTLWKQKAAQWHVPTRSPEILLWPIPRVQHLTVSISINHHPQWAAVIISAVQYANCLSPPCVDLPVTVCGCLCCRGSMVWLHSQDGLCAALNAPCCRPL